MSSRQATPGSSAQVPDLSLPRWRESSILSLCLCSRRGTAIPGSKRPVNRAAPFSRLASSATGGASPGNSPHATRGKAAGLARGSRRRSCPAPKSYLSSRQATPGSSLPSRNSREARPSRAPLCRVPIDFTSSGEVNSPCGKVLAVGQNAWARLTARLAYARAAAPAHRLLIQQAGHAGQLLALQELQGGASQQSSALPGTH